MLGRYAHRSVYRELFQSRDFFVFLFGTLLIPFSYVISALFSHPEFFRLQALPGLKAISFGLFELGLFVSILINGVPIVIEAAKGLWKREINVDELVSIAIVACLASGEFFEAATVSAIMVLGSLIEEAVSDGARNSIKALVELAPETARLETSEGNEIDKPVSELKLGDIVVLRPGDTVPVDGLIIQGSTSIDEASLTGESIPRNRKSGDELSSGTRNIDGFVKLKTLRAGADSSLSRIISLIQEAETNCGKGARIVDRYAVWFTPVILTLAGLTWIFTGDAQRAITVLIVGCPCSFLLSGPVPTVAAIARAARLGILVKGGLALENLVKAEAWFFDKTGTLTKGKPSVASIKTEKALSANAVLALAASVEQGSEHPLGRAIVEEARTRGLELKEVRGLVAVPGTGISGLVEGRLLSVGIGSEAQNDAPQSENERETAVVLEQEGERLARFYFRDEARPEAASTLAQLKNDGVAHLALLSGDQKGAVAFIAQDLGLAHFEARLRPEDKLKHLEGFKVKGQTVVFVGDGLNDAPALQGADVGIALGERGVDAALETADIVLLHDKIELVPFLRKLGQRMALTIRTNIALSFSINAVSLVLAYFGILSPVLGAVSHNLGSVLVVALSASIGLMKDPQEQSFVRKTLQTA